VFGDEEGEATMCRLCNDIAEDAIKAKCRHIFDRECIKQYLSASIEEHVRSPCCIVLCCRTDRALRSRPAQFVTLPSESMSRRQPWSWKCQLLRPRVSLVV
jgi:hypothetical protein